MLMVPMQVPVESVEVNMKLLVWDQSLSLGVKMTLEPPDVTCKKTYEQYHIFKH